VFTGLVEDTGAIISADRRGAALILGVRPRRIALAELAVGHIDGTGELARLTDLGANLVLDFRAPPALLRYVVEKGSIAVAGVSLTVNAVDASGFSVAIIPHTRDHTTLGDLVVGDRINLEVDILAKHVEKLVKP